MWYLDINTGKIWLSCHYKVRITAFTGQCVVVTSEHQYTKEHWMLYGLYINNNDKNGIRRSNTLDILKVFSVVVVTNHC